MRNDAFVRWFRGPPSERRATRRRPTHSNSGLIGREENKLGQASVWILHELLSRRSEAAYKPLNGIGRKPVLLSAHGAANTFGCVPE